MPVDASANFFAPARYRSALVAAAADVKIEVAFFLVVLLEEDVGIILADVLDVFDVLDLGNFLFAAALFGVGILEGHHFGLAGLCCLFDLDLLLFFLFVALGDAGLDGALIEVGAGVGFAGIGRNDRIAVEVVELLAGFRIFPLGAAVVGH